MSEVNVSSPVVAIVAGSSGAQAMLPTAGATTQAPGENVIEGFASVLAQQLAPTGIIGEALANLAQQLLGKSDTTTGNDTQTSLDSSSFATDLASLFPGLPIPVTEQVAPQAVALPQAKTNTLQAIVSSQQQSAKPDTAQMIESSKELSAPTENTVAVSKTNPTASFAAQLSAAAESAVGKNVEQSIQTASVTDSTLNTTAAQTAIGQTHTAPTRAVNTTVSIETPVTASGWDHDLGQKLTWMVGQDRSRADIVLNPPHLGKLEVSLSMNGDQTNALFVSASPTVREALEQALPRLREMLADAGINLGQANVSSESSSFNDSSQTQHGFRHGSSDNQPTSTTTVAWSRQGNGLIDTFA